MTKLLRLVAVCLVLQGCALTDAELDVRHDATKVSQGPLSEVDAKMFVLNDFQDARTDTARVGYKKNGFGQNMGDIATLKPVPQVIADAVDAALVANGHTIGNAGVAVDGVVNQFWVDLDVNFQ